MIPRILMVAILLAIPARAEDLTVTGYRVDYNEQDGPYVVDMWTVPDNFINTGLAYDPEAHLLYCSHLDFAQTGECIESLRKSDGTRLGTPILVNPYTALIQGLTFDPSDATFWIWGGNVPYEMKYAAHFDAAGTFLGSFLMPGYPGSLDLEPARGVIIEKAMNEHWVYFYTSEGERIDEFFTGYGEEGIAYDPFDGTYWVLDTDLIHHIRRSGGTYVYLGSYPNPSRHWPADTLAGYWEDGEAEGIVVDPSDHTLWMNADQHCHGGIPGGNRCWHIDPLHTWDKFVRMPQGVLWRYGRCDHVVVDGQNALRLGAGYSTGTYLTAILDFDDHIAFADSTMWSGEGAVSLDYRGTDAAPTTAPLENLTLTYYDARNLNDGWGLATPGPWQSTLPTQRFVQVRLTIAADPSGMRSHHLTGGIFCVKVLANPTLLPAQLRLELPSAAETRVVILDPSGRRIGEVLRGLLPAGIHRLWWRGSEASGAALPVGIYYCRAEAGEHICATRLLIVR